MFWTMEFASMWRIWFRRSDGTCRASLPTPILAAGMHNFHSPLEFACLEEMEASVKILVEWAQLWGKEK